MYLTNKIETNSKQCQLSLHNFVNDQAECYNQQCKKQHLDQAKLKCFSNPSQTALINHYKL